MCYLSAKIMQKKEVVKIFCKKKNLLQFCWLWQTGVLSNFICMLSVVVLEKNTLKKCLSFFVCGCNAVNMFTEREK